MCREAKQKMKAITAKEGPGRRLGLKAKMAKRADGENGR